MASLDTKNSKSVKNRKDKARNRLIIDIVIFLVLAIIGTLLLNKALMFEKEKIIKYSEKSDLDYKVYLVRNNFYDDEYLEKDMLYVASLIDHLIINFDYNFESEDNESIDFNYSVIAKLSISNPTGTKSYFEKTYPIIENKIVHMRDTTSQNIREEVKIDYPYYNSLANSFKNQYGVDADSKLTIYMIVDKVNTDNTDTVLDTNSIMNIDIPLSEKSVDISLDYKKINETSSIIKKQTMQTGDYILLGSSIVLIILSLVVVIKAVRNVKIIIGKRSAYDRYVNKLLKEYDRLIAESQTLLSFADKEVINISKFTELLDIHDNLQIPIMYYETKPHESCYFYVSHDKVVYLLEINAEDLKNN